MTSDKLILIHKIVATVILIANVYFIELTVMTIQERGGPMGFGLLVLPVLLSFHMFIYSALKGLLNPSKTSPYFKINIIGVIWISLCCGYVWLRG